MVDKEEQLELTAEEKKEIHKEIEKVMSNSKNITQELEMTLDKLNITGYKELKHPMFWYLILTTAMRVVRENTTSETFYDFMEFETNDINEKFKANEEEIEENKGRVN